MSPRERVFKAVVREMQQAEEAGGPEGMEYQRLMVEIVAEAASRLARFFKSAAHGSSPVAPLVAATDYYTSRKSGPHIPGKSRSWMLRQVRSIPGARKIGRDWVIKVSDFESYLVEQDTARIKKAYGAKASTDSTDEALVEEAMQINGLRRNTAPSRKD